MAIFSETLHETLHETHFEKILPQIKMGTDSSLSHKVIV